MSASQFGLSVHQPWRWWTTAQYLWKTFFYLIPNYGILLLTFAWCLYSLLWCHIIYSLYDIHITISILALDFFPFKYIYGHQKWWPCWIAVAWADFTTPIACGTYRVGALCRRLMGFLTSGSLETPLPDMLAVKWYYVDTGLNHNDDSICIITQLPRKICTAKNLWAGFDTIFDKV